MKKLVFYLQFILKHSKASILLLVLLFTASSCEDGHLSNPFLDDEKIITRDGVTDPILQYGYLLFEDRQHLLDFYDYLEMEADTATELLETLEAVAVRLGHTSLLYSDTSAFIYPAVGAASNGKISDPLRRVILNNK